MTTGPSGGVAASRLVEERKSWRKVGNCNATDCLVIWVLQRAVAGIICFGCELAWPRRPAEECNTSWLNPDCEARARAVSILAFPVLRSCCVNCIHHLPNGILSCLWQAAPPVLEAVPLKLPNLVSSISSQACRPYRSD